MILYYISNKSPHTRAYLACSDDNTQACLPCACVWILFPYKNGGGKKLNSRPLGQRVSDNIL